MVIATMQDVPPPPLRKLVAIAALKARYAEPHRYYHRWSHIEQMLDLFEVVALELNAPTSVRYAICYHDAVYDVRSTTNEEDSAALLRANIAGVESAATVNLAAALVLATKKHVVDPSLDAPGRSDCATFLDLDMSILGADPRDYADYARNIRREYAIYPDAIYAAGRIRVMDGFLERPTIYMTARFQEKFEAQARRNVEGEIAALRAGRPLGDLQ